MATTDAAGIRITIPVLLSLLAGAAGLGGSSVGFLQSYTNSATAVKVAVQHGSELDKIRSRIAELETSLVRRTAERWTRTDQLKYETMHEQEVQATLRRLNAVERIVDREFGK